MREHAPETARAEVEPEFEHFDCGEEFPGLHVRLAEDGPASLAAPEDKPWGLREMWLTDPDGTVVRLATAR